MRKGTVLVCAMALVFSLAGCGKDDGGKNTSTVPSSESTVQGGTEAPQGTQVPDTSGSGAEDESVPSQNNPADGTGWSEEMEAVKAAVVEKMGENYWPNMQIAPEMLEGTFGISSDLYDDYMGEMPMISTNVDTLVIIKAKEGKVKDVESAVNQYRDTLVNDTMQYPMNLGKIQASRIEVIGSYVCFVQLGADTTAAADESEEAVIEYCQDQNEMALEAISSALAQ